VTLYVPSGGFACEELNLNFIFLIIVSCQYWLHITVVAMCRAGFRTAYLSPAPKI